MTAAFIKATRKAGGFSGENSYNMSEFELPEMILLSLVALLLGAAAAFIKATRKAGGFSGENRWILNLKRVCNQQR